MAKKPDCTDTVKGGKSVGESKKLKQAILEADKFLLVTNFDEALDKWYIDIWHANQGKIGSLSFAALKQFVEVVGGK